MRNDSLHSDETAPVDQAGRLVVLDVLRGVAVLGILLMNIQSFGLVSSQYANPKALGDPPPVDWLVWLVNHVVADEKFISMLTILFGAGLLLMARTSRDSVAGFERLFRRRMGWLLVFGLLHGLLIWPGDILAAYAVCGLIVMRYRHLEPLTLVTISAVLFAAVMVLWMLISAIILFALPGETIQSLSGKYWTPSSDVIGEEVARHTHGWVAAFGDRAVNAVGAQVWMLLTDRIWRMTAMMFLGMALLKVGFLSGSWRMRHYQIVAGLGLLIGVPVIMSGVWFNEALDWDFRHSIFLGRIANHWGSVAICMAWLALIIMMVKADALGRVRRALEAVGSMAMTNYLGQSLICGAIFYGFGLGLFSALGHLQLLGVVLLIWAFQIVFSLIWRRLVGRGPFETAWRRLSQPARSG
ncbi:MAG: DUF418 domain-containing protein [Ectothiorhodospiraceae bacterium]|nr:DUF418 domain-containing protein [Ectothiorhodospiraceae bacterium]MCH8505770.1 DUF418 domain-containing protein [Ectothiorhodospiraceae bacterium]